MKLSAKARYGLKAMCVLAQEYESGAKSLNYIAEKSGLSEPYLEKLLAILRKAELVETARGASGGYFLARKPSEIGVGEIVRALEDGLEIVDCIKNGCALQGSCPTHEVWNKLYLAINDTLDKMSLADIAVEER